MSKTSFTMHNGYLPILAHSNSILEGIAILDEKCQEANIDENDFTTYTYDELMYELSLGEGQCTEEVDFPGESDGSTQHD